MTSESFNVDGKVFFGRIEEQDEFRKALREVLRSPRNERFPYVFLLYGDRGIGKTALAKRFRDIAQNEHPFAGKFEILWVDWDDERKRSLHLKVGREHISLETVFDILYEKALDKGWSREFSSYQNLRRRRAKAEQRVMTALAPRGEQDDLAALRRAGTSVIAKILHSNMQAIDEDLIKAFLDAGIKAGAEQVRQWRIELERRIQEMLDSEHYDLFVNPNQQLARNLAAGLQSVARRRPLLVVLDTYEIVDRADFWMREVIRAAGPRLVWVISGRNDLTRDSFGDEYYKGYAEDFPRRLEPFELLPMAHEDIRAIFAIRAPNRPLDEKSLEAIYLITQGVPLAVHLVADLWVKGCSLAEITGDIVSPRRGEIERVIIKRYFRHVPKADQLALWALALANGDVDILDAMLRPEGDPDFDLEALLSRLERDYGSVHYQTCQLHDAIANFLREYLKHPINRKDKGLRGMIDRAVKVLRKRIKKLQDGLSRPEDRCDDDDWIKAVLGLTENLFWLDETEAWRQFIPRFVEGLAYSRDLQHGLVAIAESWSKYLSNRGKNRLRMLKEQDKMLDELNRLEKQGFMSGEGEKERIAILAWQRGRSFDARGEYTDALAQYEHAANSLPSESEKLKKSLGKALYELAGKFLWSRGGRDAVYSAEAERILSIVVEWQPKNQHALYRLGVALYHAQKYEEALAAYQQAINLDPQFAHPHNGMGDVYQALGKHEEALAAYQQAINLDPQFAHLHNGMGDVP